MGYKELSAKLHQEFCEYIQSTHEQRYRGALIPRGHFKSTIVSKCYPVWRLLSIDESLFIKYPFLESFRQFHDPNMRVVIVGESHDVAAKNLKDIKWNLQNNEMLRWLFPEIIPPDINATKWTDDEILLPRSRSYDESSITTLGVGAKTTGKHWDIIIYDDLIGEKASKSEAEMEAAKHWFKFAPGLANNPSTVEELFIGTRWKAGTADLYGYVMATLPSELAEVTDETDGAERVNSEGERVGGFVWYIRSAIEPNPETGDPEPIFPERFSLATLAAIERREGAYAFSCNYLNNPTAEGVTDFDLRWVHEYKVDLDNKTIRPTDGTPPIVLAQLLRISFYDPSAGGRTATCEAAIVGVGCDSLQRHFLLEEWSKNTTYGKAACRWFTMNDKYMFYKNYYEEVSSQKAIVDIVYLINQILKSGKSCPHCEQKHRPLRIEGYKPPGGAGEKHKADRIRSFLQDHAESGRVYTRWNSHRKFRTQLSEFPHGALLDVLDAVAYAMHIVQAPRSDNDRDSEQAEVQRRKAMSHPRTHTSIDYGGY